jgi:probable blue pigment (indigoidine) exporter
VLFQRRFSRDEMLEANSFQLVGGVAALLVATALLAPTPLPHLDVGLGASLAWMGVMGTGVAYAVWYTLLGRTRAATLSGYLFLVPVVALVASVTYFGERLTWLQLLGVGLVLVSVYGIGTARWADETAGASAPITGPSADTAATRPP